MGKMRSVHVPMDRDYYEMKAIMDRKAARKAAAKPRGISLYWTKGRHGLPSYIFAFSYFESVVVRL